jgi:AcrR family transcriptional regulator
MSVTQAKRRIRPSQGARTGPLTRDEVTAVALAVAERGELDMLTMRSLAEELGVTAMALYSHVANKDDILDEIIDQMLEREAMPLPGDHRNWKAWTIEAAERLRGVLTRYPALLDRYCRRPVGVPAALRRMEASLEVLRRAGFDDEACIAAYTTIHTYTLGFTSLEIAREIARRQTPTRNRVAMTEASPHYWPAVFAGLPGVEFPNLTRLAPDLAEFTNDDHFREGLRTVLEGLDHSRP